MRKCSCTVGSIDIKLGRSQGVVCCTRPLFTLLHCFSSSRHAGGVPRFGRPGACRLDMEMLDSRLLEQASMHMCALMFVSSQFSQATRWLPSMHLRQGCNCAAHGTRSSDLADRTREGVCTSRGAAGSVRRQPGACQVGQHHVTQCILGMYALLDDNGACAWSTALG